MTDKELFTMVLDALSNFDKGNHGMRWQVPLIKALRARLAQPEQEPVAWISHNAGLYHGKPDESLNPLPLYTAPPQRKWVGLTAEERREIISDTERDDRGYVMALVEAKLKEKNG